MPDGLIESAVDLGREALRAIPPIILAFLLLNLMLVGAVVWHEDRVIASTERQIEKRTEAVNDLLKACIDRKG